MRDEQYQSLGRSEDFILDVSRAERGLRRKTNQVDGASDDVPVCGFNCEDDGSYDFRTSEQVLAGFYCLCIWAVVVVLVWLFLSFFGKLIDASHASMECASGDGDVGNTCPEIVANVTGARVDLAFAPVASILATLDNNYPTALVHQDPRQALIR